MNLRDLSHADLVILRRDARDTFSRIRLLHDHLEQHAVPGLREEISQALVTVGLTDGQINGECERRVAEQFPGVSVSTWLTRKESAPFSPGALRIGFVTSLELDSTGPYCTIAWSGRGSVEFNRLYSMDDYLIGPDPLVVREIREALARYDKPEAHRHEIARELKVDVFLIEWVLDHPEEEKA